MKELSIEEKAKRYDEAIERANSLLSGNQLGNAWIYKLLPELKESEDERIRKALIEMVHDTTGDSLWVDYNVHKEDAIAWLEKQGEHANFLDKIQVGDKVTRNEDGVLVNLSQLKRVAKSSDDIDTEKQGEQKPADKIEPKLVGWSEEDERMLEDTCRILSNSKECTTSNVRWLKSLRPKNKWKPSDKQMEVLWKYAEQNNYDGFILTSLHEQLKKLKG